jgi:hypothetical protein
MKRFFRLISGSLLLLLPFCPAPILHGEDYVTGVVGPFGTLNNTDSSLVISPDKAQDLLNVEITPGGKSVKKRKGYATALTTTQTASAVHGVYNFYESGGSDVSLIFNSTYLTSSVGGASATVMFSTGPSGATWQCTDSAGFAYCANTSRTGIVKTNGTTHTTLPILSSGTMVTVTPERLVHSGFASFPSRIDFSKANDFSTWTTGAQATDPITFTITSPGAKVTHITYAFGRVMWFKDSSFGYILIGNQPLFSDWQVVTVSQNIGTIDNTSVYDKGILYFRGQDSHIYSYDGSNITKLSREITTTVNASQSRTTNAWLQTTQSDFEAGSSTGPTGWSDTTSVPGKLQNRTTDWIQTSAADFGAGSVTAGNSLYADTNTVSGSLQTTFPDPFNTFRTGSSGVKSAWTIAVNPGSIGVSGGALNMVGASGTRAHVRTTLPFSSFAQGTTMYAVVSNYTSLSAPTQAFLAMSSDPNNAFGEIYVNFTNSGGQLCVNQVTLNSGSVKFLDESCAVGTFKFSFPVNVSVFIATTTFRIEMNGVLISSGTHAIADKQLYGHISGAAGAPAPTLSISDFSVAPQTFTWTSQSVNTGIVSPQWDVFSATQTGDGNIYYKTEVSADNLSFDSGVSVLSDNRPTSNSKQYVRVSSQFRHVIATTTANVLALSEFDVTAYSSGTYNSQVKNAPSITAWDTFGANVTNNGGSHVFYMRSATGPFTVNSATPSWTSVANGAVPTISTGVYFQVRDIVTASESTHTVSLDDFTVNWFEGAASDKTYATYFNDALWWSVASGTGASTNNYIQRYDLLNNGWTLYDIASNGFLVRNQHLYFGSAAGGYLYKYGDVDNDNGSAINAYWKSKDFFGDNPFTDKELNTLSISATSISNSTMTLTYTINGSSSVSSNVSLNNGNTVISRKNFNLPAGRVGSTFNFRFGNNAADQPFEVLAIQYGMRPKSWRPE